MDGRGDGGAAMGSRKDKDGHKPAGREARLGEALRANLLRRKQPADDAPANPADQAMLRRADRLKPKLAAPHAGAQLPPDNREGPEEPAD